MNNSARHCGSVFGAALLLIVIVPGCTSAPDATLTEGEAEVAPEPVEQAAYVSERARRAGPQAGAEDGTPAPTHDSQDVTQQKPESSDGVVPIKRRADELLMRRDGRPSWWFDDVISDGDRASICAEALGTDMLDTRRAAVDAAEKRLRREFRLGEDAALPATTIERSWIWPLPNSRAQQGNRYAGYAMVTCRDLR